jgi:hypothetical protein
MNAPTTSFVIGKGPNPYEHRRMTILAYVGAAVAEIAGCFSFWAWLRLDKSIW